MLLHFALPLGDVGSFMQQRQTDSKINKNRLFIFSRHEEISKQQEKKLLLAKIFRKINFRE